MRHRNLLSAGLVFVTVTLASSVLHAIVPHRDVLAVDDVLTGAISTALLIALKRRDEERERDLERRLTVQREMNHHIRNALQPIVYANSIQPTEYAPMVRDSVKRIEWALKEVLEKDGDLTAKAFVNSDRIDKIHPSE